MVHDKTELALTLFALVASFEQGLFLLRIYFLTQLTSHVSLVFGFLGLDIELSESASVDDLSQGLVVPAEFASLVQAAELLGLFQTLLGVYNFTVLKKEHFDFAVSIYFLHFIVNLALLFVAQVISELFSRVRVLIEVVEHVRL